MIYKNSWPQIWPKKKKKNRSELQTTARVRRLKTNHVEFVLPKHEALMLRQYFACILCICQTKRVRVVEVAELQKKNRRRQRKNGCDSEEKISYRLMHLRLATCENAEYRLVYLVLNKTLKLVVVNDDETFRNRLDQLRERHAKRRRSRQANKRKVFMSSVNFFPTFHRTSSFCSIHKITPSDHPCMSVLVSRRCLATKVTISLGMDSHVQSSPSTRRSVVDLILCQNDCANEEENSLLQSLILKYSNLENTFKSSDWSWRHSSTSTLETSLEVCNTQSSALSDKQALQSLLEEHTQHQNLLHSPLLATTSTLFYNPLKLFTCSFVALTALL